VHEILMTGEECAPCGCHLIETKPAATKGTIPTCTPEHKRRDEDFQESKVPRQCGCIQDKRTVGAPKPGLSLLIFISHLR